MAEVMPVEVGDRQLAEGVVEDRGRHLDGVVAAHDALRLEAGEGEGLHELLQRHAVLQADRHGDGEVVHQRAERGAFLVHVDEDLAETAILIFAGPQIDLVPADGRLLGVTLAALRQLLALGRMDDALDDLLDHLRRGCGDRGVECLCGLLVILDVVDQAGGERLAELRAVAIERVGFQAETPGQHVGLAAFLDGGAVRHVDRLRDRARDEGLGRRHHGDVAVDRQEALADAAAHIGAVEHRQVLVLQMRRAFQRHRSADMRVGGFDGVLFEAERLQHVEAVVVQLRVGEAERFLAEIIAESEAVEGELHVEGAFHGRFDLGEFLVAEALVAKRARRDRLAVLQAACADGIVDDVRNLRLAVAEVGERFRDHTVDDLEVAAAGELLELDDGEVRLDAGRVAIHDQADGACRCDDGRLRVAVAVFAAELDGFVPRGLCRIDQLLVGAGSRVQRNRQDVQALVALCLAMRRQPVVLHHPQHMLGVLLVLRERPYLAGDLRRGGVGNARHDRRDRATDGAALVTVIGVALRHQQAADIGETKAEGAVLVGQLGDFLRRELRHQDRDLEGQGPEAAGMLEGRDVEAAILVAELHQVQRR